MGYAIKYVHLESKVAYHGYEDAELGIHFDGVAVCEEESLLFLLLGGKDNGHLLGRYGQHGQLDAIEFVETAPAAGLCQTFVDTTQAPAQREQREQRKIE